jgi:hypothetical protein
MRKSLQTFFLALIPKSGAPKCFNDYRRPISLLNFFFKIITKIMAFRLAPLLPSLVSQNQVAFIRERSIHDHIAFTSWCNDLSSNSQEARYVWLTNELKKGSDLTTRGRLAKPKPERVQITSFAMGWKERRSGVE